MLAAFEWTDDYHFIFRWDKAIPATPLYPIFYCVMEQDGEEEKVYSYAPSTLRNLLICAALTAFIDQGLPNKWFVSDSGQMLLSKVNLMSHVNGREVSDLFRMWETHHVYAKHYKSIEEELTAIHIHLKTIFANHGDILPS